MRARGSPSYCKPAHRDTKLIVTCFRSQKKKRLSHSLKTKKSDVKKWSARSSIMYACGERYESHHVLEERSLWAHTREMKRRTVRSERK